MMQRIVGLAFLSWAVAWPPVPPAHAQETSTAQPYSAIDSAWDAFRRSEAQRRSNVRRQVRLNEEMAAKADAEQAFFYYPTPHYEYFGRLWDRGWMPAPPAIPHLGSYVVTPWGTPLLLRRSYLETFRARQSLGQRQTQTGPNRWESRPIYRSEIAPTPPTASPVVSNPRAF